MRFYRRSDGEGFTGSAPAARQPERELGDDAAHDLARPSIDRGRGCESIGELELAVLCCAGLAATEEGRRCGEV